MKPKDNILNPDEVIAYYDKHYGIGLMSAIGFRVKKNKENYCMWKKQKDGTEKYLGYTSFYGMMKVALENGYNPTKLIKDKINQTKGFGFETDDKVYSHRKSKIDITLVDPRVQKIIF